MVNVIAALLFSLLIKATGFSLSFCHLFHENVHRQS